MKNKQYIVLSFLLIAFVIITSYTPKTAQAEVMRQKQGDSEVFHNQWQDQRNDRSNVPSDIDSPDYFEEDPSKLEGNNQIYREQWGFFNATGTAGMPIQPDSRYSGWFNGCMGSSNNGDEKVFYIPVNVPDGAKGSFMHLTYYNEAESPGGFIYVALKRKRYDSIYQEEVTSIRLEKHAQGGHYTSMSLGNHTFDTNYYLYWIEFELPMQTGLRYFCGVQISYTTTPPPLFPLAFPGVMTGP